MISASSSTAFFGLLNYTERKIIKFLPFIYNQDSILSNQEIEFMERETLLKQIQIYEKAFGFGTENALNVSVLLSNRCNTLTGKSAKNYKWCISKVVGYQNGKFGLQIFDCYIGDSMVINLEQLTEPPCKSMAFDSINNYIFLFDNKESIYVLSGKIEGKWATVRDMNSRTIGILKLNIVRKNPVLYCFNTTNGPILLVVGGYSEQKKGSFQPLQDILVFSCNFSEFSNMPNFKIRMRYPRPEPFIGHMKYEEKQEYEDKVFKRLYIFGGVNDFVLKTLKPTAAEKKHLLEGNEFCETILLEDIEAELLKGRVMSQNNSSVLDLNEIQTKKSFGVNGDDVFKKKLPTLARGAVMKYLNKTSNSKSFVLIGVGKKKQKMYEIGYIDEKGQQIQFLFRGKIGNQTYIGNHMVCMKHHMLCYLTDKNEDTYYKLDMVSNERSLGPCNLNCRIF